MVRTGKKAVVGGVVAVVVGAAGVGCYNVYEALFADGTGSATTAATETDPPTDKEVRETAQAFLTAWAKGDVDAAAVLTDNAEGARQALTGYREDALVTQVSFRPGKNSGAKVPFTVTARMTSADSGDAKGKDAKKAGKADKADKSGKAGKTGKAGNTVTWKYESALRVVRGKTTGKPLVDWQPSVVHPGLRRGESLETSEEKAPPVRVVDRDGTELTAAGHPSLSGVLPALRESYGRTAGGVPGIEVRVRNPGGGPGRTLRTVVKGRTGTLRTTLDERLQRAAEAAVRDFGQASVAVVKPSTGEILAFANHRTDAFNAAFEGRLAPGSTMKVVSAAMLMEKGLTSAGGRVDCPKYADGGGRQFHNQGYFAIKDGTFADSFARSCNTAFIGLAAKAGPDDLAKEAREVFGLGLDWKAGVPTFDGSVPPEQGTEAAAELIGQGRVQASPLNMASVAATARSGSFAQPVLVPKDLDDRPLARARRALPPAVAGQLRAMMRQTAVSGTARQAMAGLGGDIGAKTGSAEADGQGNSDSWFLGYRGDTAAAAVVQQGGHGGDAAGTVVRKVLAAGG
ncbi:penicillin-binding transpeptidase domain-containing protein [Streptomyces sp. MST-110588]|uniref:penicillin-binding transpeptidase domain-containing protein n=1 Tax=Streptomyces sp. MST-110588 TaxID=2833628 RepID=UPI001F5D8435|nr:penicillin-binding transpeptidase domain-containing protein [Streptomyces sp. MST-110588]UNO41918.1 penicillin-binding protein [Streptomyces sp. MST-110588]